MFFVLDGLSFYIKVGEIIVFVGLFGGGKIMLIKLFFCFYEFFFGIYNFCFFICDNFQKLNDFVILIGLIYIDKKDIKDIKLESLRQYVGLVLQDIVSFIF